MRCGKDTFFERSEEALDPTMIAILGIVAMLILIFSGANIGLCMFVIGFIGYAIIRDWGAAFSMLKTYTVSSSMNYTMTVIPLFVLMGQFAFHSGISDDLFRSSRVWFGKQRGSLAYSGVVACALFGAICGSLAATTATMSRVAKPIMKEHGYKDEVVGGTLACAGTLGVLIPPSTPFILYGIMAEVSIGSLFAAGVVPGIIMALCFCAVIFIWCRKDKEACPASKGYSLREKIKALKGFGGMFLLFAIVLGGMFSGIFSVTESAAIGAVVAFLFMLLRGRCNWASFKASLYDTVTTLGMVMLTIVGANIFGCFLTVTNLPSNLATWIQSLSVSPTVVVFIIILIYGIMGCVMDTLALVLLSVPIFMPVVTALGFNPVWFGVILVMIMNLGAVTPPVGLSCYVASGVTGIPLSKVFKGSVPFLLAFLVAFLIVVLFPDLSLWLPSLIK